MRFFWLVLKVMLSRDPLPVSKARRILAYCRLRTKQVVYRMFNTHVTSERLFGREIALGDYDSFIGLYEEIYMGLEYFFRSSTATPVILDAGSNIGMASLFFAMLYPQATILCFEPSRSSFQCLQKNIAANYPDTITAYQYALDANAGEEIQLFSTVDASLMASIRRERNAEDVVAESVETATLSRYIQEPVELLKIDIEGNEHAVAIDLQVHDKWRYVQQAFIEYHHHISPDDDRLSAFLGILEQEGFHYQIHSIFRPPFQQGLFQDIMIYAYR